MNKLLTLGADPEILVVKGGKISHCIGKLGGTKEEPVKVLGGALQEDNVLFEFNIDPCSNLQDFQSRIKQVIAQGQERLGAEYSLSKLSSHSFTAAELAMMPESAFVFGCEPDFNGLTGNINPGPKSTDAGLRTAGGHIHFGVKELLKSQGKELSTGYQRTLIVLADYFLGLPSLLLDTDDRRRELYGKAGAMRFKDYGAEYRTLSNFWIHDDANVRWAWDQSQKVVSNIENIQKLLAVVPPVEVQNVINTSNRKMAEQMVKKLKLA